MMQESATYDTAIVGGGLAGLALSIQLAKKGFKVILFEKEAYPFHKVCGEYISMESWPFLESLGVPLTQLQLPRIEKLLVSAPNGEVLEQKLPLGGFGISRYKLDAILKDLAAAASVQVMERCKVSDVTLENDVFKIQTTGGTFLSKVCCGGYGKKSNLDVKWKRSFTEQNSRSLNHYTGVKYHLESDFAVDSIALHNFKNGYCGISKIEDNRYCLCYLTRTDNLKDNDQSIEKMEEAVLFKNPHLKQILLHSKKLYEAPVSISQISFLKKTQIENHVLMLGDAAGLITPLCGNGMSMALHSSKLAAPLVEAFLQQQINREDLEQAYVKAWRQQFASRLMYGRIIQSFFGNETITNWFIRIMKKLPVVTHWLISRTHGKPF